MTNPPAPALPPGTTDKAPQWKISPANGKYYINSVAVSADGEHVVGGTFYHHYNPTESRRGPALPASPVGNGSSPDDGKFGVYCYDASGRLLWADEFEGWQGVYWVAISADGSRAAAGGFMSQSAPQGFVRAYDVGAGGRSLLSIPTEQRVNQVALSRDGAWLVSAAETLRLFKHVGGIARPEYEQADEFKPNHTMGIVSAAISGDGLTVVCADFAGQIRVFANVAGKLTLRAHWKVPGTEREDFCHMIDLAPDGKTFAAGGADGAFYFFDVAAFIAQGGPTGRYDTGVAGAVYGVAVEGTGRAFAGVVNVPVVNDTQAGKLYVVPVPPGASGAAAQFPLAHNPNSVALNAARRLCAVADGHPDGTPGCFYLFDLAAGALRWQCPAGNMSWPVVIAADGSAVVGGSDDSNIYYLTP